jgi:hypothetical protein
MAVFWLAVRAVNRARICRCHRTAVAVVTVTVRTG